MSIELVSKFTEDEAREFIEEVKGDYGSLRAKIATMWKGRIWLALGYESWQECIDTEFGDEPIRPPKELEQETIEELRSFGMSTRGIATATDISQSTVARRVAASTDPNGSVDDTERIMSLDGKSRPAMNPRTATTSSAQSVPDPEDVVDAEVIEDNSAPVTAAGQSTDDDRLASDLGIEPIEVSMSGTDAPLSGTHIVQVVNELHAGARAPLPQVKKKSKLLEQAFATGLANNGQFEDEQITDLGQDVADTVAVLSDLLTAMDSSGPDVRSAMSDRDTSGSIQKAVKNLRLIASDRS